ncbi:MAG TPA: protein kinase, partial [Pirellulales bacterium]|nr:protein kinase [Pirellulales bacterium]
MPQVEPDEAPHPAASDDRDERLAGLLAEVTDQLRAGKEPPIDELARRHPELAGELRELWAAVLVAEQLAGSAASGALTLPAIEAAMQPRAELPGKFGDYELLEELGRGGMGVVYKARQISLGRYVAVKMVLRGVWASAADMARFRAEAEAAARLNHPHVVPVYEVGEQDGHPYFSMKYVA